MNNSNSEGLVTLSRNRSSLIYDINEKEIFSQAGYKKFQSSAPNGFVKPVKTNANGKVRLTYDVSQFVTLQEAMSGIYSKQILVLTYNMLSGIIELRDSEFIHRENISLDPRNIFVDLQTYKTHFVYLPIERKSSPGAHIIFEKKVRNLLAEFIHKNQNEMSSLAMQICRDLMNFQVNTQDIVKKLQTESMMTATAETAARTSGNTAPSEGLKISKAAEVKKDAPQPNQSKPAPEDKPKPSFGSVTNIKKNSEPQGAEREINELLRDMSQKSYNSTNPNNRRMVERTVKKEKKKMKKETARVLIFFGCYFPILFVAMFLIFNYYRNSGMNGSFVFFIIAVLMVVFMAPVIFFTRKPKKDEETVYEPYVPASRAGFRPFAVVSVSNAVSMEFFINKEEYTIGKMKDYADGIIPFDKTVSDVHCKLIWDNGYFIQDLNSDYGTFVDEIRVVPGQNFPLKNGSKIKISKNVFEVKMF